MEAYARDNHSEIIILPAGGREAKEDLNTLVPFFDDYHVEKGILRLNDNIKIEQFNVRPQQIDPITGLSRFAQRETTIVFASPKQRMAPVPHSNHKHPKFLVTTGACTYPRYATSMDMSSERRRLGKIALRDHIYGALVVEVVDKEIFHMRHLRANTDGEFVDFGTRYNGRHKTHSNLEALIAGDFHNDAPNTDKLALQALYDLILETRPKRLVLHDFFDGHSVSHWVDKKYIEQKLIQQMDNEGHKLRLELQRGYDVLMHLNDLMEGRPIFVVYSNHNEFLNRYLNEGRFMKDPVNARLGFELAGYMAKQDYNNPTEAGIKMMGKVPRSIKFLRIDADLKVRGYQLGSHGDKGYGGLDGYGSMSSKENDFGKSITGHVHRAQILRNTYTVGTTALPLTPYYMRGYPTAQSHAHGLLWDTGTVQLVNVIDGKYRR